MANETFNKKDREKKKRIKQREKLEKKSMRKANSTKGKSLDEMLVFVDAEGNLTNTPPDELWVRDLNLDIKAEVAATTVKRPKKVQEVRERRKGKLSFFDEKKGYGFIADNESGQSVFVHKTQCKTPVFQGDTLYFELEKNMKGSFAMNVDKIS